MLKLDKAKIEGIIIKFEEDEFEDTDKNKKVPWIKVAMMHTVANKSYARKFEAAIKPHRRKLQLGIMSDDEAEKITLKLFCDNILLDWGNWPFLQNGEGYSSERAQQILSNPEYALYFERFQNEAQLQENFRNEQLETDAGN